MELSEGLAVAAVVADTSRGAAAALEDAHRDPLRWASGQVPAALSEPAASRVVAMLKAAGAFRASLRPFATAIMPCIREVAREDCRVDARWAIMGRVLLETRYAPLVMRRLLHACDACRTLEEAVSLTSIVASFRMGWKSRNLPPPTNGTLDWAQSALANACANLLAVEHRPLESAEPAGAWVPYQELDRAASEAWSAEDAGYLPKRPAPGGADATFDTVARHQLLVRVEFLCDRLARGLREDRGNDPWDPRCTDATRQDWEWAANCLATVLRALEQVESHIMSARDRLLGLPISREWVRVFAALPAGFERGEPDERLFAWMCQTDRTAEELRRVAQGLSASEMFRDNLDAAVGLACGRAEEQTGLAGNLTRARKLIALLDTDDAEVLQKAIARDYAEAVASQGAGVPENDEGLDHDAVFPALSNLSAVIEFLEEAFGEPVWLLEVLKRTRCGMEPVELLNELHRLWFDDGEMDLERAEALADATRGDARVEVASVHQLLVRWIEESHEYDDDDDDDDADDAGANDDDEPASDGD